jgi:hypothetical protein
MRGQDLHALGQVAGDALLHGIEGRCRMRHLHRPLLGEGRCLEIRPQALRSHGQLLERAGDQPHGKPGAAAQQQELRAQQYWQPARHRRG